MNEEKGIFIEDYSSVSCLGKDKESVYLNWLTDKTGIISKNFPDKTYAVAPLNDEVEKAISAYIDSDKTLKNIDRTAVLAMYAAEKLKASCHTSDKLCINIGSSRGATAVFEKLYGQFIKDKNSLPPYTSPLTTLGNISGFVRKVFDKEAFIFSHSVTCSTAMQSLANGVAWLKSEMADVYIAGASEAPLTPFTLAQMDALKIYSKQLNNPYPCRPLEFLENTMVLGEGAFLFKLTYRKPSEVEGSPVELLSVGYASEEPPNFSGIQDSGTAFKKSMLMAMEKLPKGEKPDAILLHAPGTIKGDRAEMNAIEHIFGNEKPLLIPSKWKTGHLLGASAAISLELAILMLQKVFIPSFPSYLTNDKILSKPIESIMINAAGFGGNAGSVIVRKRR